MAQKDIKISKAFREASGGQFTLSLKEVIKAWLVEWGIPVVDPCCPVEGESSVADQLADHETRITDLEP
jgi:hypothetical protein